MTPKSNVLAFGAAGQFAGLATSAIASTDRVVRGFVHEESEASMARGNGATDVFIGDMTNPQDVAAALSGMEAVFYIAPAFMPEEAEVGRTVVDECKKAGVRRFVFSSVIHPTLELSNHAAKAPVEDALLNSGMEYTMLHPTLFFQNYKRDWNDVRRKGVLSEPWSADTRFSRVDYRDVAEVAAMALSGDRLLNGTFQLCADGWSNRHEVAALMSEVLGRSIEAGTTDPATLKDGGGPMRPMFDHYNQVGLKGSSLTLNAILQRKPRTLHAYLHELNTQGEET